MCVLAQLSSVVFFSQKVKGVERGVSTRRPQMVWPMMTVTVTNFEGKHVEFGHFHLFIFTQVLLQLAEVFDSGLHGHCVYKGL